MRRSAPPVHRRPKPPPIYAPKPPRFIYVGSPEMEAHLIAELGVKARSLMPGIIGAEVDTDPVFGRTLLRHVTFVESQSLDDLATAILDVPKSQGVSPNDVFIDAPELMRDGSAKKATHPLEADARALREIVDAKLVGRRAKGKLPEPTGHRVQAMLLAARKAVVAVSVIEPGVDDDPLRAWPSLFPAGRAVPMERARDAPSSAHRKLDEALLWLAVDVDENDVVIDLGAAPGGWTRVMRDRGAKVVAVDRADLDGVLARDANVTHLRQDALSIDLDSHGATAVLCDVIWAPEQALVIAKRVMASKSVRWAVITFKLKQPVAHDVLKATREALAVCSTFEGRLKHLMANKLEVTLLLRRL